MRTTGAFDELREKIVACRKCQRLSRYITTVAADRPRRYKRCTYWASPLPGFGDPEARLLVVGLAPAAHGGNRTGRMFTGDSSGDWLVRALYKTGFANQPISVSRDDGLELIATYITAVVRCAPPKNKPTRQEILNCSSYLAEELKLLKEIRVVLTLGRIAFEGYLRHLDPESKTRLKFRHGLICRPTDTGPLLVASYHPSRQNTQTGRLTWRRWIGSFKRIRQILDESA